MKFKKIYIKNFRNFNNIEVELDNKNIIFGLNDVGKTNFLNAIRFLFDRKYRSNGFKESDFHQCNTEKDIVIGIEIDISDCENNDESQLIIHHMKGYRSEDNYNVVIQLTGRYDRDECIGEIELEWGSSKNSLDFIPTDRGSTIYRIDKLFNVHYINSFLNLEQIFKQYNKKVLSSTLSNKDDTNNEEINRSISESINNLEQCIEQHPFILQKQSELEKNYKKFRPNDDDIKIKLKPDIAIKGYTDTLVPYVHKSGNASHLYPTNGDGRKKLLSYALIYANLLENKLDKLNRIDIFLLEEPENHLHFSLQTTLSKQIFKNDDEIFKYLFMTTHSNKMLNYLDNAQLIKISNESENKIIAKSSFYSLQTIFAKEQIDLKFYSKKLSTKLSEALFYKDVLLVEGPSEYWLFYSIYEILDYDLEGYDKYILVVDGIDFKPYIDILKNLGINCMVKTDNDLQKTDESTTRLLGINRCLSYLNKEKKDNINKNIDDLSKKEIIELKKQIFIDNKTVIDILNNHNIYLSKVDLENDLYEACPDLLDTWIKKEHPRSTNPVSTLQSGKKINMINVLNYLTKEYAEKILEDDNFKVLKKFKEL